jgi:hypothetical protein
MLFDMDISISLVLPKSNQIVDLTYLDPITRLKCLRVILMVPHNLYNWKLCIRKHQLLSIDFIKRWISFIIQGNLRRHHACHYYALLLRLSPFRDLLLPTHPYAGKKYSRKICTTGELILLLSKNLLKPCLLSSCLGPTAGRL